MSDETEKMGFFERYLSLWVALCIVGGIVLGKLVGNSISILSEMNIATVNIPVAILVWLMIFPMMVQIDFSSIKDVSKNYKGLSLTVVINWLIKPFSMAFFAWFFQQQDGWGLSMYEQDWMCTEYDGVDALQSNITMGDLWLKGMAAGAQASGRTVQYCMPYPNQVLSAAAYSAVTNARATGDYFPPSRATLEMATN